MEAKKVIRIVLIVLIIFAVIRIGIFAVSTFLIGKTVTSDNAVESNAVESEEMHVLKTLPEYDDGEQWIHGFRDFTVYGEYRYNGLTKEILSATKLFKAVDEEILEELKFDYIKDFEDWVQRSENSDEVWGDDLTKVYKFKTAVMDTEDWYYLESADPSEYPDLSRDEAKLRDYTLYYFDFQSGILYLMHNHF